MRFPDEVPDFVDWTDPVNRDEPLNRGLASWWLAVPGCAGYGSARWLDLCNRSHGALTNSPTWGGSRGRCGGWGSLSFATGSLTEVTASVGLTAVSRFTLGGWFRTPTSGTLNRYLTSYNGPDYLGVVIERYSDNIVYCYLGSSGIAVWSVATTIATAEWRHLVLVFDGAQTGNTNRYKIYIDGRNATDTSTGTIPSSATIETLRIGGNYYYFTGQADGVRLYSRALSAAEVRQLYADECSFCPRTLRRVPRPRRYVPGGFNPAWARGSNVLLCPGALG